MRRISPTALNKLAAVLLALVFLGLLFYDLSRQELGSTIQFSPSAKPAKEFGGTVTLGDVHYVTETRSIVAALDIVIEATRPGVAISNAAVAFTRNSDNSIDWTSYSSCPNKLEGENTDASGVSVSTLVMGCGKVTLLKGPPRRERLYPFDSYSIPLSLRGCVNANDCSNVSNLAFSALSVDLSDPDFVANISEAGDGLILTVGRRFFVQMAAVVFFVMALIFLFYLAASGDATDLLPKSLGFFATLWGLRAMIVPASIKAFPTTVDYAVFTIFSLLFATVLFKLPAQGVPHEAAATSVPDAHSGGADRPPDQPVDPIVRPVEGNGQTGR